MKKFLVSKFVFAAIVFAACFVSANAQRQTPGRPSIEGQVLFGEGLDGKKVAVSGGTITWNNYQYLFHTSFGAEVFFHPYKFIEEAVYDRDGNEIAPAVEHVYRAFDITGGAGYFIRALASRNRAFILSIGANLYTGVMYCNEISQFTKPQKATGADPEYYNPTGYLLHLVPEAQMEVFPFSNVSIYVSARPRITLVNGLVGHSDNGWFHFSWGSGLKFYF